MSILTPFVRQLNIRRKAATYEEESQFRQEAIYPHSPPEQVDYQSFNPRPSRRYLTFFLHPYGGTEDRFVADRNGLRQPVPGIPGEMASWGYRFNVYVPEPGTFGERYEMGAPD